MMNSTLNSTPLNQMIGEHDPGQRRDALEEGEHRRNEVLRRLRLPDQHCEQSAEQEGAEQAAEDARGGKQHVDQQRSGDEDLDGA
jgi:hypothetical protein